MSRSLRGIVVLTVAVVAGAAGVARAQAGPDAPRVSPPPPPPPPAQQVYPDQAPPQQYPQYQQYPPGYPNGYPPGYGQPYYPPGTLPPYARVPSHVEERPNYGIAITGASIFGGTYLFNVLFGGIVAGEGWLYVPLIGPWGEIGHYANSASVNNPYHETDATDRLAYFSLALDGLAQAAGAAMLIAGLVTHHKVTVVDAPRVSFAPLTLRGGGGLAASGSF